MSRSADAAKSLTINFHWLVFTGTITIWTIISNFIVLLIFIRNRKLHNPSNLLVTHLALTDFLLAIMVLPLSSVYDTVNNWPFSHTSCTYWLISDVVLCTASIWSLVCIAFDRYLATSYPFWYRKGLSIAYRRFIPHFVVIWTISLILSVPQMAIQETSTNGTHCQLFDKYHYVYYSASASFLLPFALMVLVYLRIFCLIRSPMGKEFQITSNILVNSALKDSYHLACQFTSDKKSQTALDTDETIKSEYENRRMTIYNNNMTMLKNLNEQENMSLGRQSTQVNLFYAMQGYKFQRRENIATKRMTSLMALYVICWMPFTIFYLRDELSGTEEEPRNLFTKCIFWLGYANSSLNPIFYTILNKEFRRYLIKFFKSSSSSSTCQQGRVRGIDGKPSLKRPSNDQTFKTFESSLCEESAV